MDTEKSLSHKLTKCSKNRNMNAQGVTPETPDRKILITY